MSYQYLRALQVPEQLLLEKARSFGRNGALDITFDTIPAIDGTEFTAVQGKEAKDKTRSEVKAAGASVAGAVSTRSCWACRGRFHQR